MTPHTLLHPLHLSENLQLLHPLFRFSFQYRLKSRFVRKNLGIRRCNNLVIRNYIEELSHITVQTKIQKSRYNRTYHNNNRITDIYFYRFHLLINKFHFYKFRKTKQTRNQNCYDKHFLHNLSIISA